jgi:hypothetical protein
LQKKSEEKSVERSSLIRWTARVLSLALAILFVALAIGEGLPPLLPLSMRTLSFALVATGLAGLLLAWRFEVVGAAVALASGVGFYLVDYLASGFRSFPGGWCFPLLLVTPLLYLISAFSGRIGRSASIGR